MRARWTFPIPRTAAFILIAVSICSGGGCGRNSGVHELIAPLLPPSPRQAADQAFSVDPDESRKGLALLASSSFGGEDTYVRLYRLQSEHPDATVRALCVSALGTYGTVEDVALLVQRLAVDEAAAVRWEAAKALQKLHSQEAIAPLIRRLAKDRDRFVEQDADVRRAAAFALGQHPEPRVFHALVGALEDTEYTVVHAAQRSLKILTGYDLGSDGALWLIWAGRHPGTLFDRRQPYTWIPYNEPPRFVDKLKFWKKKREVKEPQPARGG